MRVALVYDLIYPYSKGGVERRVADVAEGLATDGHEVHVFGTKMWDGPDTLTREGVVLHGIPAPRRLHSAGGHRSIFQALVFALRLLPRLSRASVDVVDIQSMAPLAALAALVSCRLRRVPTVVTWHEVWGPYWREYLGPFLGRIGVAAERLMAAMGHAHVAVSDRTARTLSDTLDVEQPQVVEGGVDLASIDAITPAHASVDIVCVARLEGHKNVEQLVSALGFIANNGAAAEAVVVGIGPEMDTLRRRAQSLAGLRFVGAVPVSEDLISIVKSARVFVSPSLREGFGLAVLEALACGVPAIVVSHEQNAAEDLVTSNHNGFVVSPGDNDEMARAIAATLDDPTTRERLSRNARATASHYPLSRTIERTASVYQSLICGLPRGTASSAGGYESNSLSIRSPRWISSGGEELG